MRVDCARTTRIRLVTRRMSLADIRREYLGRAAQRDRVRRRSVRAVRALVRAGARDSSPIRPRWRWRRPTRDGRPSVRTVLLKGVDVAASSSTRTTTAARRASSRRPAAPACCSTGASRAAGAHRRHGREGVSGRVRRLLRDASAREPLERLRVAPERSYRQPRGAKSPSESERGWGPASSK